MFNKVKAYLLLALAVALFLVILYKPLSSIDKSFTDIQFEVRGEVYMKRSIFSLLGLDKEFENRRNWSPNNIT